MNVPIKHCFPSTNKEYLWETLRNYTIFETGICGAQNNIESVP